MLGRTEQFFTQRLFDDTTALHDTYAMGDPPNQVEIVADQQQRHAQPRLQFLEQFEDLQLHGNVQRRGRFIGDQQLRLVGQGHGDHHALALAAGQFVRVGADALARLRYAHQLEQFQRAGTGGLAAQALVDFQYLVDLLAHRVQRVERGHGLLEDHGDTVATDLAHGFFVRLDQVLPVEMNLSLGVAGQRVGQQAQDGMCGDRLARAAFAHQRQGFALADVEGHALYHALDLIAGDELDGKVADLDQVLANRNFGHLISLGRRHRAPPPR